VYGWQWISILVTGETDILNFFFFPEREEKKKKKKKGCSALQKLRIYPNFGKADLGVWRHAIVTTVNVSC
jgi:hypothetical protein